MTTELADQLWQNDRDLAKACLDHPFVQGLANGQLPSDRYRNYVAQDAFFLQAFANAYALAGRSASDEVGRALYSQLADGIAEELQLHRSMSEKLDIDLEHIEPATATLAYTEFLLQTAHSHPEPGTAAAMLPCLRLYAWLGQQLLPTLDETSPWAEWVRTYADPGFDDLWRMLAPRLENDSVPREELARLHRRAMELEYEFFAASWDRDGHTER